MPRLRRVERVQAALAVIERGGKYLICRRRDGDILGGYWELPGGKARPGEAWAACLRRELWEELGVRASGLRRVQHVRHQGTGGTDHFFVVFRCDITGGPRPFAAADLRWVPRSRLGRYRFPPANQPILARLKAGSWH
jgi:8-oxo-dGTP diphosphatase